jgi:hypothetical protein
MKAAGAECSLNLYWNICRNFHPCCAEDSCRQGSGLDRASPQRICLERALNNGLPAGNALAERYHDASPTMPSA